MNEELFSQLLALTEEEEEILENHKVNKTRYTSRASFVVESNKFLAPDKSIMIRKHTRFTPFPKHKHDYVEINYVLHGSLKQTIGSKKLHLQQGELLFLNQHIEHEIERCGHEDIIINFIIQPHFFEYVFAFLNLEGPIYTFLIDSLHNVSDTGQFLHFKVEQEESVQRLIVKIVHEIMNPTFMSEATVKLYVGLLIVELTKHADRIQGVSESSLQSQWMQEALTYIHNDYRTASLYELSRRLNQPHYLLSKTIKKLSGQTFKVLLKEKRLGVAKELLEGSKLPVSIIAEEVGYGNISYFYSIFKEKYGMTPHQWRKRSMSSM
ncbi:AraC family transcriptional regulator [Shouchella shacheensis]|uniref:AraC family transcriptional regulator n=1 Tax=Shouchella shacheensis TaxID=1649580 RepID=UPI00074038F5|nr:AraC family transcriptional regulator [Shouchella shacheensis]